MFSKQSLLITFLILLSWHPLDGNNAQKRIELTIEEALSSALKNNPSVHLSSLETNIANRQIKVANAPYETQLNLSTNYSSSDQKYAINQLSNLDYTLNQNSFNSYLSGKFKSGTSYSIGVDLNESKSDSINNGYNDIQTHIGIRVTQPILKGLNIDQSKIAYLSALTQSEIAKENERATKMNIALATLERYARLFYYSKFKDIAHKNLELSLELLEDNQERLKNGAVAPIDVFQARSQSSYRNERLSSAKLSVTEASNSLKLIICNEFDYDADEEIVANVQDVNLDLRNSFSKDYETALIKRSDLAKVELEKKYLAHLLEFRKKEQLPSLNLTASAGLTGRNNSHFQSFKSVTKDGKEDYSIGLTLSKPIWGKSKRAETDIAELQISRIDKQLENLRRSIYFEIKNARERVKTGKERLAIAKEGTQLAQKSLDAENEKFLAGSSTTFVILNLQSDLTTAKNIELQAFIDYYLAQINYFNSTGELLEKYLPSSLRSTGQTN